MQCLFVYIMFFYNQCFTECIFMQTVDKIVIRKRVVLRKRAPKCDIELFALDLHVLVANRLVQCATYTV